MLNKKPKEQETPENEMYEVPIAYIVELKKNKEGKEELPNNNEETFYSGYIHHFLNYQELTETKLKINGPLVATTILKMPFNSIEYCLYAMMNLLRSDIINYSLQNEEELIKNNETLKLTQVTREELIPGIEQLQNITV